jgi:hypothetical protein
MSQIPHPPPQPQGPRLVDVEVNSENSALNLLVSFLGLAQRRGAFGLDEAAKIFECVKVFQKPAMPTTNTVLPTVNECCQPCEEGECPTDCLDECPTNECTTNECTTNECTTNECTTNECTTTYSTECCVAEASD